MTNFLCNHSALPPDGVMLKTTCPEMVNELICHLRCVGKEVIASQLEDVIIPFQALGGHGENFSFMAYPIPRLTFEQRQLMDLQDTVSLEIRYLSGLVRIDLDDFGKINWFYITGLPGIYSAVKEHVQVNNL